MRPAIQVHAKTERVARGATLLSDRVQESECGLDLETPSFQKGLRNVLRVLVAASPLAQSRRPDVLVRRQLELFYDLLKRCYRRNNRADWFRLAPVRVSTTLCHMLLIPLRFVLLRALSRNSGEKDHG